MKGYEYVHYMTLEEWKLWADNYDSVFDSHIFEAKYREKTIKEYLLINFDDFETFMDFSFSYKNSPQGFDYWCPISERKCPISNSVEKVKYEN